MKRKITNMMIILLSMIVVFLGCSNENSKSIYTESSAGFDKTKKPDLYQIPWIDILELQIPKELDLFAEKYDLWNFDSDTHNITHDEFLCHIWIYCASEQEEERELYWKIFHHVGNKLLDAGFALEFDRFCWIQCKKDPLVFYKRYCKGDSLAIERYYNACQYDYSSFNSDRHLVSEKDVRSVINEVCEHIRRAYEMQIDNTQRENDAEKIKYWLEERVNK